MNKYEEMFMKNPFWWTISWSGGIFSALFAFVLPVYREIYDYLQFVKSIAIGKGDKGRAK